MTFALCKRFACGAFALTICGASACASREDAIDPDGRAATSSEDRVAADARVRDVSLESVVAAVAGVPVREAPATLARWLRDAGPSASALLGRWPRRDGGALDLDRPPLLASAIDADVSPRGKTSCGVLSVVFRGEVPPAIRFHLDIPATSAICRDGARAAWIHDAAALPALDDALRAATVPDVPSTLAEP